MEVILDLPMEERLRRVRKYNGMDDNYLMGQEDELKVFAMLDFEAEELIL
jgi:hypothetical protein